MSILNEYIERRIEGMDYSEMHKELNSLGYDKVFIKDFINEVDAKYLLILAQKNNRSFSNVLNGSIRLILGIALLFVFIVYTVTAIVNASSLGFIGIAIISISFSAGSWFFTTGLKVIKKASKKKINLVNNKDLLD